MKRLICLFLCIILACFTLVGCSEDAADGAQKELDEILNDPNYKPDVVEEMTFDFYIVTGKETSDNAKKTVTARINSILKKYSTTLDIHYITKTEYEKTVKNDLGLIGDEKADIVLITSESMFDSLYASNSIANLTDLLKTEDYKSLNSQICDALIKTAVVTEEFVDEVKGDTYTLDFNYCIPNNHIVGYYTMVLVNRKTAEKLNMGTDRVVQMTSANATETQIFMDRLEQYGPADGVAAEDAIKFVTGTYADIAKYEAEGYYVNATAPVVTRAEAFSSAFAIAKHPLEIAYENAADQTKFDAEKKKTFQNYYNRCMQVIYELNTNSELRDLLQYGEVDINYTLDANGNIVPTDVVNNKYVMDLLYTGDIFKASYCSAIGWTAEVMAYGKQQNLDALMESKTQS